MYAGIDFGTSNSTVVGVTEDGSVETFDIDPLFNPRTILRSAIYFPSSRGQRPLVGGQAYRQYRDDLEEEGEAMGRFIRSLKSHLGSDLGTYIHSKRYTLTDLSASS
jgi:molecular chaperone DnaK (HSP70)